MRSEFPDHFSRVAAEYAEFRPRYPESLFEELSRLPVQRRLAWDCGTGSGQAAVGLAKRFDRVVATEPSGKQLAEAERGARIHYARATAERAPLRDRCVDLVTAAQALHWFDTNAFFREARRVLVSGGVVAVWCYGLMRLEGALDPLAGLDAIVRRFHDEQVAKYWPPERQLVETGYRTIEFPFDERGPPRLGPDLALEQELSLAELAGYVRTWSATQRCAAAIGRDPVLELERELAPGWGELASRRKVRWPLSFRIGINRTA